VIASASDGGDANPPGSPQVVRLRDTERRGYGLNRDASERRAISPLQYPRIYTLYDAGHQHGTVFLFMEHPVGETLAHSLANGPLSPEQVRLDIGIEICEGLNLAHRAAIDRQQ
jgi:hypothetical protein